MISHSLILSIIILINVCALLTKNANASNGTTAAPTANTRGEYTYAKSVSSIRHAVSQDKNNPYHEPLAALFVDEAMIARYRSVVIQEGKDSLDRNELPSVVARHMIIDQMIYDSFHHGVVLVAHHPKQIVIFGAGFDTRANKYAHIWPIQKWFEIDLPEPQKYKIDTLAKHSVVDPTNLKRISMDLTDHGCSADDGSTTTSSSTSWLEELERAGWDPSAPTIYVLEGLLYYFTTEEAKALLSTIPSVPESKIILTMVDKSLYDAYARFGVKWSTNLTEMRKAGAFRLDNYKLKRNLAVVVPKHCSGLEDLWVRNIILPGTTIWDRLKNKFQGPTERVLEFEAV